MCTTFNENVIKCAECGVESPATAESCWNCRNTLSHRTRWRVGCYYCGLTMDFIWASYQPVRKSDLDYMTCTVNCADVPQEYNNDGLDPINGNDVLGGIR